MLFGVPPHHDPTQSTTSSTQSSSKLWYPAWAPHGQQAVWWTSGMVGRCFGSTFRPRPGRLECLRKTQDNIMLNNALSQLSRG